jgi:Zn-dependent peptidase ImmA (M78 family)
MNQGYGEANYNKAKLEAVKKLEECGIIEPAVNPIKIAREYGVNVFFVKFDSRYQKEVSGFFDAKENSIYINADEYPPRQTFTIAHELGHKFLHEEWAKSSEYRYLPRSQVLNFMKDGKEQEADCFAANLLVPEHMIKKYQFASVDELAKLFVVSRVVIVNRLKHLGLSINASR